MINNIDTHHIETLKTLALTQAGIKSITPADCRNLSNAILKKTGLKVSETTIKRLYGFALSNFSPSYFTLNSFALYCGYDGWDSFRESQSDKAASTLSGFFSSEKFGQQLARSLDIEHPLISMLLDTAQPTLVLKANAPDFTILTYNDAYQIATHTKNRNIKGSRIWDVFAPDNAGGGGPALVLEAFYQAIFNKGPVKMDPLHYNIRSEFSNAGELNWWDVNIRPVITDDKVKYLVVNVTNITHKVLHQDAIEQAIMSELTMTEDLAQTNVQLNIALANLEVSHRELMDTKTQLEQLNLTLEETVFERTRKFFDSEARQRKVVDNAPVAIAVLTGPDHVIEIANKKIIDYWGKTAEVINKPLAVALPEIKGQPFIEILDKVRQTGIPYINSKLCAILNKNGEYQTRYFDTIYQPLQATPGITYSTYIIAVDITERVNMQKELEQSESLLRLAVNAARIGTWSFDPLEKRMKYNNVFAEILGWESDKVMSFDEAIGQVTDDYKARLVTEVEKAITDGGDYDYSYTSRRFNDNKVIWLRAHGKIIADGLDGNLAFSGIIRQIDPLDAAT